MRDCCCLLLSAGPGLALPLLAGGWATGCSEDGRAGEEGDEVAACATATVACAAAVFSATVLARAAVVCTELSCMGGRATSAITASDSFTNAMLRYSTAWCSVHKTDSAWLSACSALVTHAHMCAPCRF